MGVHQGSQLIVKMKYVVARELDMMVDLLSAKFPSSHLPAPNHKTMDCDVSNILHELSFKHSSIFSSALLKDVALFLKLLAANTGYIIIPILDGDVRPQTKRDAFRQRFDSTMIKINSFFFGGNLQ